jgi:hypothetical protein
VLYGAVVPRLARVRAQCQRADRAVDDRASDDAVVPVVEPYAATSLELVEARLDVVQNLLVVMSVVFDEQTLAVAVSAPTDGRPCLFAGTSSPLAGIDDVQPVASLPVDGARDPAAVDDAPLGRDG